MPQLSCPACGLTLRLLRAPYLPLECCPRCRAKAGISVPLKITDGPPGRRQGSISVPGALQVRTRREPDTVVLVLRGELALGSAPILEQSLIDAEGSGAARVLIDLSELEFLDSAGLHALLDGHRRLCERGLELVLRPGPRAVQRMFELTGAGSVLRFED